MNGFEQFKQKVEEAKSVVFGEIDAIIAEVEESGDLDKFYDKGIKSAGGRLRKQLQNVRKAIHNPTNAKAMTSVKDAAKQLREDIAG